MKLFSFLIAVMVLATACQNSAQEKVASSATTADEAAASLTTIQWLDSARNMGQINEGQKIEISFRFKNTGSKPLVIKDVQPSCGCTVPSIPKEPIAPGEEGVIKGIFDSAAKPGINNKTMTVIANTEGSPQHVLSFTVDVKAKPKES